MNVVRINGQAYRLSSRLSAFQQEMHVHLIDWKWKHITRDAGVFRGKEYDVFLPDRYDGQYPTLYPDVVEALKMHLQMYPFRIHKYFYHMASSQAANINLFLPVLLSPSVNEVLRAIRPDFARLATDQLDNGYRIEFWDEPFKNLGDKNGASGTDSDIAIAYYDHRGELCLWLIEHKLTESEFSTCGGFKSKHRKPEHDCTKSFSEILADKSVCYYHDVKRYHYWDITGANRDFFACHTGHTECPFQGGMNQLWRNQLLAMAMEQDTRLPYRHASFSVVRHPDNQSLDKSIASYRDLIGDNSKFSVFTSANVVRAASQVRDARLDDWVRWYCDLYNLRVPERAS